MPSLLQQLRHDVLLMDGAMGTFLQSRGFPLGTPSDIWNLEKPEEVLKVHKEYINAGSGMIFTNTFCGTSGTIKAGCRLAKKAAGDKIYVAGSLGPTENLNEKIIELLLQQKIDLIVFETMTKHSIIETAVKTTQRLSKKIKKIPIMVLMTVTREGFLPSGEDPVEIAKGLEENGVEIVGLNCSFGPESIFPVFEKIRKAVSCFVAVKPNVGLPQSEGTGGSIGGGPPPERTLSGAKGSTAGGGDRNRTCSFWAKPFIDGGANLIGGCCGTTPEDIRELAKMKGSR